MVKDTILYDRLGVSSNANEKELKKAYHKLSMKWHPDKNNSDGAKEKFQEISEAYSILSDKSKRNVYDQVGIDMTKNGGEMPVDPSDIFKHFMSSMGGMDGFPFGRPSFGGAFSGPFGGPFAGSFGGGFQENPFGPNMAANHNNVSDYKDCFVQLDVSLEDLYNEKTVNVEYNSSFFCKECDGYGTKNKSKSNCNTCDGSGKARITRKIGNMIQQIIRSCPDCNGTGEKIEPDNICKYCNGDKFKNKNRSIEFVLNKNYDEGNNITIKGKGNVYRDRKTDLIIKIVEKEHPVFTKLGNNLHMSVNIKLYQLLFGLNKSITHLDGRKLFINIPKFYFNNFDEDLQYSVNNEGFSGKGNLILHITIDNINTTVLQENEATVLKKLLVKCDLNEFKKEVNILKNKDTLVKTNISKYIPNNTRDYHQQEHVFETDDEQPECVTQ